MTKFDVPSVLWNMPQTLTDPQKAQARSNIGAAALLSLAPAFSTSTAYNENDVVTYDGKLYVFTADKAAGAWDGTKANETTIWEVLQMAGGNEKQTTILSAPIYIGGDPTDLEIYEYANAGRAVAVTFSALCPLAFTPNGGATLGEVSFDKTKVLKIKRARIKTPGSIGLGAGNGKKSATLYLSTGYFGSPISTAAAFAMQFSAFNEWEDMNLSVDYTAFALSSYKMAITTTDGDSHYSTFTIDDYNLQSSYVGEKLTAYLEIEVESEDLA